MLLTTYPDRRRVHLLLFLPMFLLSATCSGCMVSQDADAVSERRVSGRLGGITDVDEPEVGEHVFAGMRRDHSPDWKRTLRAEHLVEAKHLAPTAKEQRMARARVDAEARLVREGGLMMYRWDGSASKPSEVEFVASPGALTIDFKATESLNSVDGRAHALLLVVYHLTDLAALDNLARHEDGMRKLLEGNRFDGSVRGVRTHFVQPGGEGKLSINRPDGGRYVAIVAGYGHPEAETSLYVTEYGIGRWEMLGEGVLSHPKMMFMPLPLEIKVGLGESEMAAKNVGKLTPHLDKTRDLLDTQVQHLVRSEILGDLIRANQ